MILLGSPLFGITRGHMPKPALQRLVHASAVGVVLCALVLSPSRSPAQGSRDARASVVLAGGIAQLPDAFSKQCGTAGNGAGTDGGLEAGAGLLFRLRWLVVLADSRLATELPIPSGCYLALPAVDTSYSRRGSPFVTSTVRVGVETPRGAPLVRLAVGSGVVWGGPPLPLAVFTAGWSTRGPGKRFFADFERAQTRLSATEAHNFPAPSFTQPIVLRPVVHTVRAGIEIPLRSTR
jgi:hypothetical protein